MFGLRGSMISLLDCFSKDVLIWEGIEPTLFDLHWPRSGQTERPGQVLYRARLLCRLRYHADLHDTIRFESLHERATCIQQDI